MKNPLLYIAIACCVLLSGFPAYGLGVPQLIGHVNDYAGMLSPQVRQDLERMLTEFERSDSTQIVVLTIPTLSGEVLEEFSIKVAEQWRIGQQKIGRASCRERV